MTNLRIWKLALAWLNIPLFAAFTMVCGSAAVCTAFGSSISIFNTGEGPGGTALPLGQLDPQYDLINAPCTVPLTAITTIPNPAWTPNTPTADWISPTGNGGVTVALPPGTYVYQTTFNLTGQDPSTAELSGNWASDNNACIELNGVNTGVCLPFTGFTSLHPFSITSGFQPGVNTLDFVVTNGQGSGDNPTGVIVEISGTASLGTDPSPEPSSLLLIGTGLLGLSCVLRRRRF